MTIYSSHVPPQLIPCDKPVDKEYWSEAVHTLVGRATMLREDGQTDFPNFFFDLAINLSQTHLHAAHAQRIADLKREVLGAPQKSETHSG